MMLYVKLTNFDHLNEEAEVVCSDEVTDGGR